MKVWIVVRDHGYEGDEVKRVFATDDLAFAWIAKQKSSDYDVQEWHVCTDDTGNVPAGEVTP